MGTTSPRCCPVCFGFDLTIVRSGKVIVLSVNSKKTMILFFYLDFVGRMFFIFLVIVVV